MIFKIILYIERLAFSLAMVLVLATTLLTFEQVVARYLFNANAIGLQELTWHFFGASFLFAIAWTLRTDEHARVDIFYGKYSDNTKNLVNGIGAVIFLLPTALILIVHGMSFVNQALAYTNTRPEDFYTRQWVPEGFFYDLLSGLEGFVRKTFLRGEISSDPGGLEGRYLIKATVPMAGFLLLIESIWQIGRSVSFVRGRRRD